MERSLSRRRAAAVRRRRRPDLVQLRSVGSGLEHALLGPARPAKKERDRAPARNELAAGDHRGRLARDHRHLFGRVEQQPFLLARLPLPGPDQPGDVRARRRERRLRGRTGVDHGRAGGGGVLLRGPRATDEGPDAERGGRQPHSVTWSTLRTLGNLRRRSSTSGGAAPSTFTSASASPLLRSRERANCAMLTCASPRVRPTLPITPGLSSLCITRMAPSGTASSSNLSTRTSRGSRLPTMVPATSVLRSLPQRSRTVSRLVKSGASLVLTSVTERPRSRASAGADTSLTGSARKLPSTPLSTAALRGAVGCCATSPA